jgi:hypothetical protein
MHMKNDVLSVLGVIAILAVLGAYFMFSEVAPEIDYKPVELSGGSISVVDQDSTDVVTLDAELVEPGWITIHFSMSGAPAEVVGTSRYLEAGIYEAMTISLSEDMLPGWRYIALLHVDNGDGIFDIEKDLPVSVNGEVVRPSFVSFPDEATAEVTGQ